MKVLVLNSVEQNGSIRGGGWLAGWLVGWLLNDELGWLASNYTSFINGQTSGRRSGDVNYRGGHRL